MNIKQLMNEMSQENIKLFPVSIKFVDDNWLVEKVFLKDSELQVGSKLISINNVIIKDIIKKIIEIISIERDEAVLSIIERHFNKYLYAVYD